MHHLLLGCFLLALLNLSAVWTTQVLQKPRFYGIKVGHSVVIYCMSSDRSLPAKWYKTSDRNDPIRSSKRVMVTEGSAKQHDSLIIMNAMIEDSGIYLCKLNHTWGAGTELQVFRNSNPEAAMRRSQKKDAIIFIQGFLLVLCVVLPLLCCRHQEKKEEAIYEEPEDDHIYAGLDVEHCLYEDIPAYSHQGPDAPWDLQAPDQE